MAKTKKNAKFYLALVIFALVGQVAWVMENMYLNVFIYKMFNASAQQISLMVAASAVAATVTTLLIGALSDKIGKRKVFIWGGYIAWGITIWAFSLVRMDVIEGLIPGVAFDENCGRLGRGKGVYDRLLESSRGFRAGIFYQCQKTVDLPMEDHDCVLDLIVTEEQVIRRK